jgi:hypothetical protein
MIIFPTGQERWLHHEPHLTETIDYCSVIDFSFRELEPYAVKVASTVLRGLERGDPLWLPDTRPTVAGRMIIRRIILHVQPSGFLITQKGVGQLMT